MKTAVVTGAACNIGKGIAKRLAADGFRYVLLDKDEAALRATAEELRAAHGECLEYVVDLADIGAVAQFLTWLPAAVTGDYPLASRRVRAQAQPDRLLAGPHEMHSAVQRGSRPVTHVDVLVNNVGYESEEAVASLSLDELAVSTVVNQQAPFYLTSNIIREMMGGAGGGNVIFITSTHSSVTRTHPLYSSSKAAVEMFMKEAALEFAQRNIRVNAVAPGPVEDVAELRPNAYVPMGFSQQPRDVAACVRFLVSEDARFITGQTLTVDGGFSIAHTHFWKQQRRL